MSQSLHRPAPLLLSASALHQLAEQDPAVAPKLHHVELIDRRIVRRAGVYGNAWQQDVRFYAPQTGGLLHDILPRQIVSALAQNVFQRLRLAVSKHEDRIGLVDTRHVFIQECEVTLLPTSSFHCGSVT